MHPYEMRTLQLLLLLSDRRTSRWKVSTRPHIPEPNLRILLAASRQFCGLSRMRIAGSSLSNSHSASMCTQNRMERRTETAFSRVARLAAYKAETLHQVTASGAVSSLRRARSVLDAPPQTAPLRTHASKIFRGHDRL